MPQPVLTPAFQVPLTPVQLSVIGYIGVVWGQVDFLLDDILAHAHHFDQRQRDRFLTDKPMGGKVDMLANDIERLPAALRDKAKEFVTQINGVKQERNAVFHGLWGIHLGKKAGSTQVASRHHKRVNNPFTVRQLSNLAREITACSQTGFFIWCELLGFPESGHGQFTWGGEGPKGGPPEWLRKSHSPMRKGRSPTDRRRSKPSSPPKAPPE